MLTLPLKCSSAVVQLHGAQYKGMLCWLLVEESEGAKIITKVALDQRSSTWLYVNTAAKVNKKTAIALCL